MNTMKKNIVVLGNTKASVQVAILAQKAGYNPFVSSYDLIPSKLKVSLIAYKIRFEEGQHNPERIQNASWLITDKRNEILEQTVKTTARVTNYVDAIVALNTIPVVLIVGSRGKSSTAHLLNLLLQQLAYKVEIAQLEANSLANALDNNGTEFLFIKAESKDLNATSNLRPELTIWLNQFETETGHQFISLLEQSDKQSQLIYNADDEEIARVLNKGALAIGSEPFSLIYKQGKNIVFPSKTFIAEDGTLHEETPSLFTLPINRGNHHVELTIAACMAARHFQIPDLLIEQVLGTYNGLPHRMEFLPKVNGIQFINDAAAFGQHSAFCALETCNDSVVWITNGNVENEIEGFSDLVCRKVKAIINIGNDSSIEKAFGELVYSFHYVNNITQATKLAYSLAEKSDNVLYSPMTEQVETPTPLGLLGNLFRYAVDEHIRPLKNHGLEISYSPERRIA